MHPKNPFCLEAVPPEKERNKDMHSLVNLHSNQNPEVQSRGTNMNPWIFKNIIYQCIQWQKMTDRQPWKLKVSVFMKGLKSCMWQFLVAILLFPALSTALSGI